MGQDKALDGGKKMEELGRFGGGDKRPGEVLAKGEEGVVSGVCESNFTPAELSGWTFSSGGPPARPRRADRPYPRPWPVAPYYERESAVVALGTRYSRGTAASAALGAAVLALKKVLREYLGRKSCNPKTH